MQALDLESICAVASNPVHGAVFGSESLVGLFDSAGPAPAYSTRVDLGLAPGVCSLDKFLGDSEACSV